MAGDNGYTVGSLFAGIGGICQGFIDAGFRISWANDFDKHAQKTYEANFSHTFIPGDIHELNPKDFDKVDIITSGFPCQAFSIAGYQKGFRDSRGNLFFETARFINELKPKAILLENVKNLVSHDEGNTFRKIKEYIEKESKYSFIPMILNTMEYGNLPQTRERIYIVGFKDEADFLNPTSKAIHSVYYHPISKIPLTKTVKGDILLKGKVDDRYYYTKKSRYYKILKESMKSKNTVYQWRRVYLRENKSNVCPTLTANMGTGGHNVPLVLDDYGMRKLTPRECARLQGFSDNFVLPEISNSHLYKQIGNSVSVPVVRRIAQQIAQALDLKYENKPAEEIRPIERQYEFV